MADSLQPQQGAKEVKLERVIGLYDSVLIILGTIIGSGIFITPTGVLSELKSVSTTLIVWVVAGLISMLGAFCFAELAYLVPKAGAGYAYLQEAFAKQHKLGNVPGFLSSWLSTFAVSPGTIAVIALTSSEYLCRAIYGNNINDENIVAKWIPLGISLAIIVSCTLLNLFSVKWASRINNVFSVGKTGALIMITAMGLYFLIFRGKTENLKPDFELTALSPTAWSTAMYYALYSFDGWYSLNTIVEEIKKPRRNLPLAILIALTLITVLYVMVNISYLTLLSPAEMLSSQAVALTWAEKALGVTWSFVILICVFISNYGSCLVLFLCNTRITYAAARDANLPLILGMISVKYLTPSPSILITAFISLFMILSLDIYLLLDFFTFIIWIFYALNLFALLVIKRRRKKMKITKNRKDHHFELPFVLPLILFLFSLGLVGVSLSKPTLGHLVALLFTLSGLFYYFPFVFYKKNFTITDKISDWAQKILNVKLEKQDKEENENEDENDESSTPKEPEQEKLGARARNLDTSAEEEEKRTNQIN